MPDAPQQENRNSHIVAVDLLKAMAIMLVIVDHSIGHPILNTWANTLWERTAIPILLLIMGFNANLAFKRHPDQSLRGLYSKDYFKRKFHRIIVPYLIIYGISTLVGLALYGWSWDRLISEHFDADWSIPHLWLGILPFTGAGDWFLPLLLQSIVILPVWYKIYLKYPRGSFIFAIILELSINFALFWALGPYYTWSTPALFDYNFTVQLTLQTSILFFPVPIFLGFWLADAYLLHGFDIKQIKLLQTTELQPYFQSDAQQYKSKVLILLRNYGLPIFLAGTVTGILIQSITFGNTYVGKNIFMGLMIMWVVLMGILLLPETRKFTRSILGGLILWIGAYYAITQANTFPTVVGWSPRAWYFVIFSVIFSIPLILQLWRIDPSRLRFILLMIPVTLIFLIFYRFNGLRWEFVKGDYHLFYIPYSMMWMICALLWFPRSEKHVFVRWFARIGQASYHILLTQMFMFALIQFYFGSTSIDGSIGTLFFPDDPTSFQYYFGIFGYMLLCQSVAITIGLLWFAMEQKTKKKDFK
jgi:peptidoglycan/LPS O-acetylase OafA/YrhL